MCTLFLLLLPTLFYTGCLVNGQGQACLQQKEKWQNNLIEFQMLLFKYDRAVHWLKMLCDVELPPVKLPAQCPYNATSKWLPPTWSENIYSNGPPDESRIIRPVPIGQNPEKQQNKYTEDQDMSWNNEQIEEDSKMETDDLIRKYGYPVETHSVITMDGYVLSLHRIPRNGEQPVLLVHGLMSSSAAWIQMGPSNGLGYILYRYGFDVWMLNTRGNIYSHRHLNPSITSEEYWKFSFHEIGVYDLPAAIDYILKSTGFFQIQYIGHSQGSTAFFAMCSQLARMNQYVSLMQSLSPTVYLRNTQSAGFKFLSLFKDNPRLMDSYLGVGKIPKENMISGKFKENICPTNMNFGRTCDIFEYILCGFNWGDFDRNLTTLVAAHSEQGGSVYQIIHYAQQVTSSNFQYFDYGLIENQRRYLSSTPPVYDLRNVNSSVILHYADDDWLSHGEDVENLINQLPNLFDQNKIDRAGFGHYDYVLSKNVNLLVNKPVVDNCLEFKN